MSPVFALPSYADIRAAAERIAPHAVRTPLIEHSELNARAGARVLVKCETLQRVGAFKFRGAFNAISRVDSSRYPGGIVAASSGNHAQGVAAAASLCGLAATIVMPSDAPRVKVQRTRAFGGAVRFYDRVREDREAIARALCAERAAAFVHPFDDAHVIAGQGTVGLEIAEDARERGLQLGAVLVPCSGGGLASGIALALAHDMPGARVHPVEPSGFDDWGRSLIAGERQRNARLEGSICDALLVATPGAGTFAIGRKLFGLGLVAGDDAVRSAMRFAFEELKLVVEPGGAIALAAVLSGAARDLPGPLAIVLSGGNVDPDEFAAIVTAPNDGS